MVLVDVHERPLGVLTPRNDADSADRRMARLRADALEVRLDGGDPLYWAFVVNRDDLDGPGIIDVNDSRQARLRFVDLVERDPELALSCRGISMEAARALLA